MNHSEPAFLPLQKPRRSFVDVSIVVLLVILFAFTTAAVAISFYLQPSSLSLTLVWLSVASAMIAVLSILLLRHQVRQQFGLPLQQIIGLMQPWARGHGGQPIAIEQGDGDIIRLAELIEQARLHWEQAPDIMLNTKDGAVPVRFHGAAATLFQALQQDLQGAVSTVTRAATQLQAGVELSQAGVRGFGEQVHGTLQQLTQATLTGVERLGQLHETMAQASNAVHMAQDEAITRLTAVVPQLEERATGLHDILQLAGQQTTTTLEHLQHSSHMLNIAAQQQQNLGQKFANDTDDLAQKLLAAVTLLRSGGKVLAETNEISRTRLHDTLQTMQQAEAALAATLANSRQRLEQSQEIFNRLELSTHHSEASAAGLAAEVAMLTKHNGSFHHQIADGGTKLAALLRIIETIQTRFGSGVAAIGQHQEQLKQVVSQFHNQHQTLLTELSQSGHASTAKLGHMAQDGQQLFTRIEAQITAAAKTADNAAQRLDSAATTTTNHMRQTSQQLTTATHDLLQGSEQMMALTSGINNHLSRLDRDVTTSLTTLVDRTNQLTTQNMSRLTSLYEKIEAMSQRLATLAQLTSTMGQVAGQLGQLIPQLGSISEARGNANADDIGNASHLLLGALQQQRDEIIAHIAANNQPQLTAILQEIVTALSQIRADMSELDHRLSLAPHTAQTMSAAQDMDQALTAVTDIFASLRDRGDDVINRLNAMASHLQNAAEQLPESDDAKTERYKSE